MSLSTRSGLLNGALAGKTIKSAEVVQDGAREILRITTEQGEIFEIFGRDLDVVDAT
jgi:hypothetical protein